MSTQTQDTYSSQTITNGATGSSLSVKSQVLDTGAKMLQSFGPVNNICAFLNAFHTYADEAGRYVEACHYCSHVNEDLRQCLIYDSPEKSARLIGVEYMVSSRVYETLDAEERKLWHSHEYEVKSGMLIMPSPLSTSGIPVPTAIWEQAESAAMREVIGWYGKTFHFWQVDRGDKLPLGMPTLMGSFTEKESLPAGFEKALEARDKRYGSDCKHKEEIRKDIPLPELHPGKSNREFLKKPVADGRRCATDADARNMNSARSKQQAMN